MMATRRPGPPQLNRLDLQDVESSGRQNQGDFNLTSPPGNIKAGAFWSSRRSSDDEGRRSPSPVKRFASSVNKPQLSSFRPPSEEEDFEEQRPVQFSPQKHQHKEQQRSYQQQQPPPSSYRGAQEQAPSSNYLNPSSYLGGGDQIAPGLTTPNLISSPAATAGHSPNLQPQSTNPNSPFALSMFEKTPRINGPDGNDLQYQQQQGYRRQQANGGASNLLQATPSSNNSEYPLGSPNDSITDGNSELLMSLMAGQARVDINTRSFQTLRWEEVEEGKKELILLSTRLESLVSRHNREQKILTAARTLDKLHAGHKRMSRQTAESLEVAEQRAISAEKDMWAVMERENILRRKLNEHWAAVLAWEAKRLEGINATLEANWEAGGGENNIKGKERETEKSIEIERLQARVQELEELVEDASHREAVHAQEQKSMRKDLESARSKHSALESKAAAWEGERRIFVEKHEDIQSKWLEEKERSKGLDGVSASVLELEGTLETVRSMLAPVLLSPPVDDDVPVERVAQRVVDEFEQLEYAAKEHKDELKEVREGLEEEMSRVVRDRDSLRKKIADSEKSWENQKSDFEKKLQEQVVVIESLSAETTRNSRDMKATTELTALTFKHEDVLSQLQAIWLTLPSKSVPIPKSAPSSLTSRTRGASIPSTSSDSDFGALAASYTQLNTGQLPGVKELADRVKGLTEEAKTLSELTAKYAKEKEVFRSGADRAQRLFQESRAGLETYQRQVKLLEDQLERTSGAGPTNGSLAQFNELERTIAALRQEKSRVETSLAAQQATTDTLSEANDALSTRALTIAQDAEKDKQELQLRMQGKIDELEHELQVAKEEVDDIRSRESGQGIALLDELNSLQMEVQTLRNQLRNRGSA